MSWGIRALALVWHRCGPYNPAMPLNPVARRYADTLLTNATEEIIQKLQEDLANIRADYAARNMVKSGKYITDYAKAHVEQLKLLTEARMDSLIKAYEKSGLLFDDATISEIKNEVMQYCQQRQANVITAIRQVMQQTFQGSEPPGLQNAAAHQVATAVDGIMARLSRDLSLRQDEVLLEEMKVRKVYAAGLGKWWDVFICHASEDKDGFVRPVAEALQASGLSVWYDEFSLKIGDSLRRKIEEGLANSRYGIVILSPNFFAKKWPQDELDGLASKEVAGTKVILPVWHNIDSAEVQRVSPMLSGRLAAKSSDGVDKVVQQLRDAMGLILHAPITQVQPRQSVLLPFKQKEPMFGAARFRARRERIGISIDLVSQMLGSPVPKDVYLREGSATWVRLMPVTDPGRTWLIQELKDRAMKLATLPLIPSVSNIGFVRSGDGCGYYPTTDQTTPTGGETTPAVSYVFNSGEVWIINCWLSLTAQYFELNENGYIKTVEGCASFLESLGIREPYRWIVGFEGIKDRQLRVPNRYDRTWGPCITDMIKREGPYKKGDDIGELLRPFFDEVFDQCGVQRP